MYIDIIIEKNIYFTIRYIKICNAYLKKIRTNNQGFLNCINNSDNFKILINSLLINETMGGENALLIIVYILYIFNYLHGI